mmetsp:Transcript_29544/g.62253  ORF Transcript_29544/g.62253 Transcript_29544/m.62253 type:complete len:86 (-) Transcript_29544:1379-1636(-)
MGDSGKPSSLVGDFIGDWVVGMPGDRSGASSLLGECPMGDGDNPSLVGNLIGDWASSLVGDLAGDWIEVIPGDDELGISLLLGEY